MLQFISKIFGTKSDKDIKRMMPLVEQTKKEGERMATLTPDELRNQTREHCGSIKRVTKLRAIHFVFANS